MGKLLDLLKASAGERNVRNALGRWRQAVSSEIDQIISVGSGYDTVEDEGVALPQRSILNFVGDGVTASDAGGKTLITIPGAAPPVAALPVLYAQARVLASGQIITGDADAIFDNADPQNTLAYSPLTGVFSLPLSLTERYVYALEFYALFSTFGTPATDSVTCTWVEDGSNLPIWAGSSVSIPTIGTPTPNLAPLCVAKTIFRSLTGVGTRDVKVRIVPTGGMVLAIGSYAIAYRIGLSPP